MFVTDNLSVITAVYQYGCRYLKMTLHGNLQLSFVDTVSDSDTYGSFISNFRLLYSQSSTDYRYGKYFVFPNLDFSTDYGYSTCEGCDLISK